MKLHSGGGGTGHPRTCQNGGRAAKSPYERCSHLNHTVPPEYSRGVAKGVFKHSAQRAGESLYDLATGSQTSSYDEIGRSPILRGASRSSSTLSKIGKGTALEIPFWMWKNHQINEKRQEGKISRAEAKRRHLKNDFQTGAGIVAGGALAAVGAPALVTIGVGAGVSYFAWEGYKRSGLAPDYTGEEGIPPGAPPQSPMKRTDMSYWRSQQQDVPPANAELVTREYPTKETDMSYWRSQQREVPPPNAELVTQSDSDNSSWRHQLYNQTAPEDARNTSWSQEYSTRETDMSYWRNQQQNVPSTNVQSVTQEYPTKETDMSYWRDQHEGPPPNSSVSPSPQTTNESVTRQNIVQMKREMYSASDDAADSASSTTTTSSGTGSSGELPIAPLEPVDNSSANDTGTSSSANRAKENKRARSEPAIINQEVRMDPSSIQDIDRRIEEAKQEAVREMERRFGPRPTQF